MRISFWTCLTFLLGITPAVAAERTTRSSKPKDIERKYIVFELTNVANPREAVEQMVALFGPVEADAPRLYGFGINAVPILTRSVPVLQKTVHDAFDLAEEFNVPVMFHLDPQYALGADPEPQGPQAPAVMFWRDPLMCEWVNFPAKGEAYGRIPRCWINWGAWTSFAPAMPCFTSPAFKRFITRQLSEGVVRPIVERRKVLKRQGKDYLFVGLNVGWETNLADYTPGRPLCNIDPKNPPEDKSPFRKDAGGYLKMQEWEMGQTGYAALHWLGWNERKLARKAKQENIEVKTLFNRLCAEVVHDYMELLARTAYTGGIPQEQIFTHIVPIRSAEPDKDSTMTPPIWTAVNKYSVPGFTMCRESGAVYDLKRLKEEIAKADPSQTRFAAAEGYVRWYKEEKLLADFLSEIFDNGGVLTCLYGCFQGGEYQLTLKPEKETLAILKWLGKSAHSGGTE